MEKRTEYLVCIGLLEKGYTPPPLERLEKMDDSGLSLSFPILLHYIDPGTSGTGIMRLDLTYERKGLKEDFRWSSMDITLKVREDPTGAEQTMTCNVRSEKGLPHAHDLAAVMLEKRDEVIALGIGNDPPPMEKDKRQRQRAIKPGDKKSRKPPKPSL